MKRAEIVRPKMILEPRAGPSFERNVVVAPASPARRDPYAEYKNGPMMSVFQGFSWYINNNKPKENDLNHHRGSCVASKFYNAAEIERDERFIEFRNKNQELLDFKFAAATNLTENEIKMIISVDQNNTDHKIDISAIFEPSAPLIEAAKSGDEQAKETISTLQLKSKFYAAKQTLFHQLLLDQEDGRVRIEYEFASTLNRVILNAPHAAFYTMIYHRTRAFFRDDGVTFRKNESQIAASAKVLEGNRAADEQEYLTFGNSMIANWWLDIKTKFLKEQARVIKSSGPSEFFPNHDKNDEKDVSKTELYLTTSIHPDTKDLYTKTVKTQQKLNAANLFQFFAEVMDQSTDFTILVQQESDIAPVFNEISSMRTWRENPDPKYVPRKLPPWKHYRIQNWKKVIKVLHDHKKMNLPAPEVVESDLHLNDLLVKFDFPSWFNICDYVIVINAHVRAATGNLNDITPFLPHASRFDHFFQIFKKEGPLVDTPLRLKSKVEHVEEDSAASENVVSSPFAPPLPVLTGQAGFTRERSVEEDEVDEAAVELFE